MLHIKFCTKCHWNCGGFLKIRIAFYKHASKLVYGNNVQQNYLSIEPLLNLLAAFVVEKTRFLSKFFQIQSLGWGYTRENLEVKTRVSLCTYFWGYLHEKSIFLKKTKLGLRKLNELNDMNVNKMLLNITNVLKSTAKMSKKMK